MRTLQESSSRPYFKPRSLAVIQREIVSEWRAIVSACALAPAQEALALEALPLRPRLLGSSYKVDLGEALKVLSSVVYMSPATEFFGEEDGRTSCPFATDQCADLCLGTGSGRMVMDPVKRSRIWKTALYFGARSLFRELLAREAISLARKAKKAGYLAAIRVDGATDLGEGQRLASSMLLQWHSHNVPTPIFWDYTKSISRIRKEYGNGIPESAYSLTFSYSGENLKEAGEALRLGAPVAVVFDVKKGEALPASWGGYPVIDGDVSDARFLDRREAGAPTTGGYIVGLRFKSARTRDEEARRSSFVVSVS